ncbi:NAD(P)H-binding protein [Streptomyces sp. WAC06614]|uniref:NAD(P)H-binding protein n=1 Tax=Streptomyces sp. WAC06614 TaxID=2487416 RepID=UPI000F782FF4|nr:NAD(P)H-binding protein [Streptomyces sp. WAC06614]RSS83880.1 NmrA family transcriptional regulator [Streptomyces sp. WAC06614]
MSILVTGGRGAVARGLTALLTERGIPFRLGSREPGTPGAVHCDLTDPATFPAALHGIRSVFLYAEAEAADAFVKEAVAAGVEHVVLLSSSSVLAEDADSALSAAHLAVEQALLASPLTVTLLRPGAFAANARGWAGAVRSGVPVRLPYPGAYADPLHEADLAEAAFAVLTDPALAGGSYTLTGPQSLSFAAQLAILGDVLGRPVPFESVTPEEWKAGVEGYIPGPYADALLAYWAAQDGLPTEITDTVEQLTGHPARSFESWVREHAADFSA